MKPAGRYSRASAFLALGGCVSQTTVGDSGPQMDASGAADVAAGTDASAEVDASSGTDASVATDAMREGAGLSALGFTPSNISLAGIDLSAIDDEDVSTGCEIRTGMGDVQTCFTHAGDGVVLQVDGSKLHVIVLKSLRLEPTGHISVTTGGVPLAIVSLGSMTILGPIDAHAAGTSAYAGGFSSTQSNQKGAGPGGGPGATGMTHTAGAGAGGGSYCGLGGRGWIEPSASGQPGTPTPAYGTPQIVPLIGGSTGGAGDIGAGAGGGALELVAGSTFMLGSAGYINVGGGGGSLGGATSGQDAGGGGSGGSILIEAVTVKVAGTLAANGGGGGGGANVGFDGSPDSNAAAGGPGGSMGGAGSAAATIQGGDATASTTPSTAGAGGGGAGRIRINSMSGTADLTGATISPAVSTGCVSQGMIGR
jgi:hypothetical protein